MTKTYIAEKQPIGTAPAWLVASNRIGELSGAIQRYSDNQPIKHTGNIRTWAREIIAQCDLIDEMEGNYGGR